MRHYKKGFTLIEIMIVCIIVGIVAAIAVPNFRTYLDNARRSEAIAALGAIRVAERLYHAEHGHYANTLADLSGYIQASDLSGTYFNSVCYSAYLSATGFTARCNPQWSTNTTQSPRANEVNTWNYYIFMNENGQVTTSPIPPPGGYY